MIDSRVKSEFVGDSAVKVEIDLKASPAKVFEAWANPTILAKWLGPRRGGHLQVDRYDCEASGEFDFTMVFFDGDTVRHTGQFVEVVPEERLVFTWHWHEGDDRSAETLVTVNLSTIDGGTHLSLLHERFPTLKDAQNHEYGWTSLVGRMPEVMALTAQLDAISDRLSRTSDRLQRLLGFVPEDKLSWSPSATSRSALRLVAHCSRAAEFFASAISGEVTEVQPSVEEFFGALRSYETTVTSREDALSALEASTQALLGAIRAVTVESIELDRPSPFGPLPMRFWIEASVDHMLGHTDQLAYLQTIWGDLDDHMM